MPPSSSGRVDFRLLRIGEGYTREQLAEMWGIAGREAITKGVFCPARDKKILLFVTQVKRSDLDQYHDHIEGESLYWEGETRHQHDLRIAESSEHGDEIHLFFRHVQRTPFLYLGTLRLLCYEFHSERPSQFVFAFDTKPTASTREFEYPLPLPEPDSTVREVTAEARVGQKRFRLQLLDRWDYCCSVSGVRIPEILRASHIRRWSDSTDRERLDPANGLLLAPQYDALFELRYISFSPEGLLLPARHLASHDLARLGVRPTDRLSSVPNDTARYLELHRQDFFEQNGG